MHKPPGQLGAKTRTIRRNKSTGPLSLVKGTCASIVQVIVNPRATLLILRLLYNVARGKESEAIALIKKSRVVHFPHVLCGLALPLDIEGYSGVAAALLEKQSRSPNCTRRTRRWLVHLYIRQERLDEALRECRAAIGGEHVKPDKDILQDMGYILWKSKRFSEAIDTYRTLIRLYPREVEIRKWLERMGNSGPGGNSGTDCDLGNSGTDYYLQ